MDLLPEEVRRALPKLYSQEHVPDPVVFAKFFTPDSGWTWFATEGEEEDGDFRFFGCRRQHCHFLHLYTPILRYQVRAQKVFMAEHFSSELPKASSWS